MADEPLTVPNSSTFSFEDPKPHFLTIRGKGGTIVSVDMDTGKVEIHGDPNEAAKVFWKAVAGYGSELVRENERLKKACSDSKIKGDAGA